MLDGSFCVAGPAEDDCQVAGQEWRKGPEELIGEGPVRRPVAGETALT